MSEIEKMIRNKPKAIFDYGKLVYLRTKKGKIYEGVGLKKFINNLNIDKYSQQELFDNSLDEEYRKAVDRDDFKERY